MVQRIKDLFVDEEGAALVEYALLLGLIAVVAITAIGPLGTWVKNQFTNATAQLPQQ